MSCTHLFPPEGIESVFAPRVFGQPGNQLATSHVLAFCLTSAGFLGSNKRAAWKVCLFWWCLDSVFEIGQYPSVVASISDVIPHWFSAIPVRDNTANYFAYGRFDPVDPVSLMLRAICAYLLIRCLITRPAMIPQPS